MSTAPPPQHEWDGRVAVLSLAPIAADQRVLRQCKLLCEMGCPPFVITYDDGGADIGLPLARWPIPRPTVMHRLATLFCQLPAHLGEAAARAGFWARARHRWALRRLLDAGPRLILANDWPALVVAVEAKRRTGCRVHYDAHEFATLEFAESSWWRLVHQSSVRHLERTGIGEADTVSTVGQGIADALRRLYGMACPPCVIRNLPDIAAPPSFRRARWPLTILYHGNIVPRRGLEMLVEAAGLWREPHELVVRGAARPDYIARLKALAAHGPHPERVRFEPAVPPGEVVAAAREADLGVFFTPLDNVQQQFTLPNKLFEYIAAGLAVAVTPAPDMVAVVARYGVGTASGRADAESVAITIDRLTREQVDVWRANACLAAAELNWCVESRILQGLVQDHLAN